jgi:hypothetical protein
MSWREFRGDANGATGVVIEHDSEMVGGKAVSVDRIIDSNATVEMWESYIAARYGCVIYGARR